MEFVDTPLLRYSNIFSSCLCRVFNKSLEILLALLWFHVLG